MTDSGVARPPAGWYADPEGRPMNRWWDGLTWTEDYAPLAAPTLASSLATQSQVDWTGQPVSTSSRLAAALLCFFLGVLGVHRFYVGKIGTGILQLLTGGGFGIWWIVDMVLILVGRFRDKWGRLLLNW